MPTDENGGLPDLEDDGRRYCRGCCLELNDQEEKLCWLCQLDEARDWDLMNRIDQMRGK